MALIMIAPTGALEMFSIGWSVDFRISRKSWDFVCTTWVVMCAAGSTIFSYIHSMQTTDTLLCGWIYDSTEYITAYVVLMKYFFKIFKVSQKSSIHKLLELFYEMFHGYTDSSKWVISKWMYSHCDKNQPSSKSWALCFNMFSLFTQAGVDSKDKCLVDFWEFSNRRER